MYTILFLLLFLQSYLFKSIHVFTVAKSTNLMF